MKRYHDEYEGQREFYRVGINLDSSHNTDDVDRGDLYENKVDIKNILGFITSNKVCFAYTNSW